MTNHAGKLSALIIAAMALFGGGIPAHAAHLASFEPAPRGLILISKPAVVWPLFLGADTLIDTLSLTINGQSYPIAYDTVNQVCKSTLTKPLASGDYLGKINVTFKDGAKYEKDWQFTVSPGAKPDF